MKNLAQSDLPKPPPQHPKIYAQTDTQNMIWMIWLTEKPGQETWLQDAICTGSPKSGHLHPGTNPAICPAYYRSDLLQAPVQTAPTQKWKLKNTGNME